MVRFRALPVAVVLAACPIRGAAAETPSRVVEQPIAAGPVEAEAAARARVAGLEDGSDAALAGALDALVDLLIATDRAADTEALELAGRAVDLRREMAGDSADLATSLTRLGEVLIARGEFEAAASALTEAEGMVCGTAGAGRDCGRTLNRLAAVSQAQRNYPEAAQRYAVAREHLEPVTKPGDAERDRALDGLGRNSYAIRDLDRARRTLDQLLDEREAALAPVRPAWESPCTCWPRSMPPKAAWRRPRKGIAGRSGSSSTPSAPTTSRWRSFSTTSPGWCGGRGTIREALFLTERALAIFEVGLGPEHPYVAGALNNLGDLSVELGDLAAAQRAHERALAIREETVGPDSAAVAQSLSNLGAVAAIAGNPERAVTLLDRALAIRERSLGPADWEVGLTLLNLGWALDENRDLERARPVLERAVAILERYPTRASNLGDALNNLAMVMLKQDFVEEADAALARARAIYEATRGHDNPRTAEVISNQARTAAFGGRVDAALGLALEAVRIGREHLRLTAAGLSEREALEYAGEQVDRLDLALSLAVEPSLDDPILVAAAWDALIRSRGQVLDEMAGRRIGAAAPEIAPLATEVRRAAGHLSRHLVEGIGPSISEEIRLARQELELAERALGEACPPFARSLAQAEIGLDEVTAALPAGAALVAYARFNRRFTQDPVRRSEGRETWYLAFVRTPLGELDVLPLADAFTIDQLVFDWRAAAGDSARGADASRWVGERLRSTIWDPVAAVFGNAGRALLVPDGELGLLNFAALPTGDDTFLVEQDPVLAILGQERDLVPEPVKGSSGPCLLAFGNPDFNARRMDRPTTTLGAMEPDHPPFAAPHGGLSGIRFARLPGTADETAAVVTLWAETEGDFEALRLTGSEASEGAFKTLAPGFRVLHLATHGFFLGGVSTSVTGSGRGVGALVPAAGAEPVVSADDAFRLSGLALAGANRRDTAGAEDGVLTAEEIAALDLSGVEWAVLSACDSGVGEVSVREGVFGLRRAFRIAGAETVIMSLWSVDDEAAREWMTALYRAHLVDGLATAEAVRRANLEVLAARRSRGASVHPSSWAPFVASGDGR